MAAGKVSKFVVGVSSWKLNLERRNKPKSSKGQAGLVIPCKLSQGATFVPPGNNTPGNHRGECCISEMMPNKTISRNSILLLKKIRMLWHSFSPTTKRNKGNLKGFCRTNHSKRFFASSVEFKPEIALLVDYFGLIF